MNKINEIQKLSKTAQIEFSDSSDYIWKSPRLLQKEHEIELDKLSKYFPGRPDLAELRWKFESEKLNSIFPYLISTGNLYSVTSLFETYLLRLSKELEKGLSKNLSEYKGQGFQRIFKFLKDANPNIEKSVLRQQVDAAIKIRNCLAHASGLLPWSRNEAELRQIKEKSIFLSKEHRDRNVGNNDFFEMVSIVPSWLGDRIQITNQYSWTVCIYFREFFVDLCNIFTNKTA